MYSQELDTDVLLAGYPLVVGSSVTGGIIMVAPLEQVRRNVVSISLISGGVALLTMLLASLLILSMSRRISGPVRQMQEAATELACGSNPTPIPVKGEDEIAQLAQAFNRMQQQLARTEQIRRDFVAHVSHELRTPLTSIQGFLQGMLDGVGKPEERKQNLEIVMREVQRLRTLTTDILDLVKLQSGTIPLKNVDRQTCPTWQNRRTKPVRAGLGEAHTLGNLMRISGPPSGGHWTREPGARESIWNALKYTPEGDSVW
jgi:signal transduction histidine kinase